MKEPKIISPYLIVIILTLMMDSSFGCVPIPCDQWITCAMTKQRSVLKKRLEDFEGAIEANRKQTENQVKIIQEEILSYEQLRARITMEAIMLKKATHISNNIKSSAVTEQVIEVTKKGKK